MTKAYKTLYLKGEVKDILNRNPLFNLSDWIHETLPKEKFCIETKQERINKLKKEIEKEEKDIKEIKDIIRNPFPKGNQEEIQILMKRMIENKPTKIIYKKYCDTIQQKVPYSIFILIIQELIKR